MVLRFSTRVKSLNKSNCQAYVGAEAKVLDFKGNLDCSKEIQIIQIC